MPKIPFLLAFLTCFTAFATDFREQAFVDIDIAWCMEPECFEDGLWRLNRSPNCKYERRSPVIRAICDIRSEKDIHTIKGHGSKIVLNFECSLV